MSSKGSHQSQGNGLELVWYGLIRGCSGSRSSGTKFKSHVNLIRDHLRLERNRQRSSESYAV